MIQQIAHTESGGDPAGVGLALAVAYALHAPTGRAPELAATPATAARRAGRATAARRRTARA
ncbi:hypothetical protein GCM10010313_37050 [Streptomyces violarus]|uniref:Uncharacterized protein n=1 Tax=Streptomyces violarus TaxID=67380 RepID=A0A7W4ZYM8_9ACTN|nr:MULTISPECIES: hypothetical protein [Streptomyces]MBB3081179.1 hypothetical protein [Streptomyces violarus]WRU00288.1 hypothetical protein VJ737_22550 [Streptomyces sp. CGMCC 4.1772]GHD12869.1 hypothetical protein GCM10010313_37050 [Streptomyces violarus]